MNREDSYENIKNKSFLKDDSDYQKDEICSEVFYFLKWYKSVEKQNKL